MDDLKQISEETLKSVLPKINDGIKCYLPDSPEVLLKYAKRFVPPKIHSAVDAETREMMLNHLLSDEDYLLTYFSILADSFRNKIKSNNPKLYLVIGQTGSGKSNLTARVLEENPNCIVLDSDKYKSYRPDAERIAIEYPSLYGILTGIDSYELRDNVYNYAINNGFNMIVEKAPDIKKGLINVDIEDAISKGYDVVVLVLAVSKLNSALSIHERYEGQIEAKLPTPKLTSLERHNQSFEGLNKIVQELQYDKRIKISVYKRADKVYEKPILIYPKENFEIFDSPYEALIKTQNKDDKKTVEEFESRYALIRTQMLKRMAQQLQYNQLEDIKKLYFEFSSIEQSREF